MVNYFEYLYKHFLPKFIFVVFWVFYCRRGFSILISKSRVLNKSKRLGRIGAHCTCAVWEGFSSSSYSAHNVMYSLWMRKLPVSFVSWPWQSYLRERAFHQTTHIILWQCEVAGNQSKVGIFFMQLPHLKRQLLNIHCLGVNNDKKVVLVVSSAEMALSNISLSAKVLSMF